MLSPNFTDNVLKKAKEKKEGKAPQQSANAPSTAPQKPASKQVKYTPNDADNLYAQALSAFNPGGTFVPEQGQYAQLLQRQENAEAFNVASEKRNRATDELDSPLRSAMAATGTGQVYVPNYGSDTERKAREWAQLAKEYKTGRAEEGKAYARDRRNADYNAQTQAFTDDSVPSNEIRIKYALDDNTRGFLDNWYQNEGAKNGYVQSPYDNLNYLSEDERNELRYIASQGDYKRANAFLDYLEPELNKRMQRGITGATKQTAYNDPLAGVIQNVAASKEAGLAMVPTVEGAYNELMGNYKPVDTNSRWFQAAHGLADTTEAIGQRAYDAAGGGTAGEIARFFADTGLSMAQFATSLPLGQAGVLGTMGAQAAGSKALETLEGGGSATQALQLSVAAGLIEAASEKIGLDNLTRLAKAGKTGFTHFLRSMAMQSGVEGAEEVVAEVGGNLADALIMGEKGEYAQLVNALMATKGMTEEEAKAEAIWQLYFVNSAKAFAGGAVSGLAFGGGAAVASTKLWYELTEVGNDVAKVSSPDMLIQAARQSGVEDAIEYAAELEEKLNAGREITPDELGRLHLLSGRYVTSKQFAAAEAAAEAEAAKSEAETEKVSTDTEDTTTETEKDTTSYKSEDTSAANIQDNVSSEEENVASEATAEEGEPQQMSQSEPTEEQNVTKEQTTEDVSAEATLEEAQPTAEDTTEQSVRQSAVENARPAAKEIAVGTRVKTKSDGEGVIRSVGAKTAEVEMPDGTVKKYLTKTLSAVESESQTKTKPAKQTGVTVDDDLLKYVLDDADYEAISQNNIQPEVVSETRKSFTLQWTKPDGTTVKMPVPKVAVQGAQENVARQGKVQGAVWREAMKASKNKAQAGVTGKSFTLNRRQARAFDRLAKALGVEVHFVDTLVNEQGQDANGFYRNGHIFIARDAENPFQWVLCHEVTHHLEKTAPRAYKQLADHVTEKMGGRVEEYMSKYDLGKDDALHEVVADYVQDIYLDERGIKELIRASRGAANSLYESVKKIGDKILGIEPIPESEMDEYQKFEKQALDLWKKCFAEARENRGGTEALASVGVGVDAKSESGYALPKETEALAQLSRKTFEASDYSPDSPNFKAAVKALASQLGVTQKKARQFILDVNSVAAEIAHDPARLDYVSAEGEGRSAFVSNAEYGGSIDFSTICPKRRMYMGTVEAIQKAMPNKVLTSDDILKIRSMMKEKGYQVACGFCYVEGSRAKLGYYTNQFRKQLRTEGAEYVPTQDELMNIESLERLRLDHHDVYEKYLKFMNKLAQRKPKLFQPATEYNGEIIDKFGNDKGRAKVADKNRFGGLRIFSFSDFEAIHMIDMMQVVLDMARVGLAGQAYTKQPDFARVFGGTGIKINLSLVANGVDENGRLTFDGVEGMKIEDAMEIRDMYPDNVGTIVVTFTMEQLKAAMADDRVDFIIPFHRSQWTKKQYARLGLPADTKDMTYWQNERYFKGKAPTRVNKNGKTVREKAKNFMPNTYWESKKDGKTNAEAYLGLCAEAGKRPKFWNLLVDNKDGSYSLQPDGSTDGYWKLLGDFKMYNHLTGKGVPQKPVKPDFNMTEANRVMREYKGGHESFPVAQDVVDEFVRANEGKAQLSRKTGEAQTIEDELNAADIIRTSKDNNKNRTRIYKYLNENYPDLFVEFENDKATGRVTVKHITTRAEEEARIEKRDREVKERRERKAAEERFFKRVSTPSGHKNLMQSIENKLKRDGFDGATVKRSRSAVHTLSFYIDDGYHNIKVSDHYTPWQKNSLTRFVDLEGKANIAEVYAEIKKHLEEQDEPQFSRKLTSAQKKLDEDYLAAVEAGDMETAQRMVDEAAREALENGATFTIVDDTGTTSFKLHRGAPPKKTMTVYKVFNVDEQGRPSATYAGVDQPIPIGPWLDAVAQKYVTGADGNKYIPGLTGTAPKLAGLRSPAAEGFPGYNSWLSYRPAFHASKVPAPLQMRIKDPATGQKTALPHNKLIFKVEISADKDYQQDARDSAKKETERRRKYWRENAEYREAKREYDLEEARKNAKKAGRPFDEAVWLKKYDAKGDAVVGVARAQLDDVPAMGYYTYRNQGEDWVLAGSFRVLGVVSEAEIRKVNAQHGYLNEGKNRMDWIGGYNPKEFGLGNLVLKEGEVPTPDDPRYKRVKLADPVTYDDDGEVIPLSERFNPKKDDIRYSQKGQDSLMRDYKRLARENARLKRDKELLKEEFKRTKGVHLDGRDVDRLAKQLKSDYEIEDADLTDALRTLAEAVRSNKRADYWEHLTREAVAVAKLIANEALIDTDVEDEMAVNEDVGREAKALLDNEHLSTLYDTIAQDVLLRVASLNQTDTFADRKAAEKREAVAAEKERGKERLAAEKERAKEMLRAEAEPGTQLWWETSSVQSLARKMMRDYKISDKSLYNMIVDLKDKWAKSTPENAYVALWDEAEKIADEIIAKGEASKSDKESIMTDFVTRLLYDTKRHRTVGEKYTAQIKKRDQKIDNLGQRLDEQKQRAEAALKREKQRRRDEIAALKAKHRAKTAEGREKQRAKELRQKIERHVKRLDQKLNRPNDKKHIPEDLRITVAALLHSINRESSFMRSKTTGTHFPRDSALSQNLQERLYEQTKRTELFQRLRQQYEAAMNNNGAWSPAYDPDFIYNTDAVTNEAMIKGATAGWADRRIIDMSANELQAMWELLRSVEGMITQTNKVFGLERYKTVQALANAVATGILPSDDYKRLKNPALQLTRKLFTTDMLTVQAFFHRFGDGGDALYKMLRDGQDKYTRILREMELTTARALQGVDLKKLAEETHEFTIQGKKITLSTAEIMYLYGAMMRDQARNHILEGGIRAKPTKGKGLFENNQDLPVKVTEASVKDITDTLTDEQKALVERLVNIMSTTLAEYGNEASMKVYNYRKFTEPNYIPIDVDKDTLTKNDDSPFLQSFKAHSGMTSKGFTKPLVEGASNPLMLGSIFEVYAKHVNEMAMYAAYLAPLENLRRVRNFKFENQGVTMTQLIHKLLGEDGTKYWDKLVADINGGERFNSDGAFLDRLIGGVKAAAVSANLRVILQQPTAIIRAAAEINPRYLISALRKIPLRGEWERIKQNAPIAQWKDYGHFDINTGRQMQDIIMGTSSRFETLKQLGMRPMSSADSFAWTILYHAVEDELIAKGYSRSNPAFDTTVAERFSDIIDKTQVVDGVLQRSQAMRSSNPLVRMSTAFMSEATKTYNMFGNAVWDYMRAKKRGDKKAMRAAGRKISLTASALVASFLVNAVAQSVPDAWRDDDRDKKFWERFFVAYFGIPDEDAKPSQKVKSYMQGNIWANFNPLTYVPFFKDIVSQFEGFDAKRMDLESTGRIIRAIEAAIKAAQGEGKSTMFATSLNLLGEFGRAVGLPVANVKRDIVGLLNAVAVETDNYALMYAIDKPLYRMETNVSRYTDIMIKAQTAGDSETALKIMSDILKMYEPLKNEPKEPDKEKTPYEEKIDSVKNKLIPVIYDAYKTGDMDTYNEGYKILTDAGLDKDDIRSGFESIMKKEQGVSKVADLDGRGMLPAEQKTYDRDMSETKRHSTYTQANAKERETYEANLYAVAIGSKSGQEYHAKAQEIGVTDNEYLNALMARSTADRTLAYGLDGKPNESQNNQYYTNDEVTTAVRALEKDYNLTGNQCYKLWQSLTGSKSDKNNPWRAYK